MIKRAALGLALSLATVLALAVAPGGATYDFAAATATPHFSCTDIGCGALTSYTYTGAGTCSAGCVGVPPSPLDATLAFSVVRTFPQITLGTAMPTPSCAALKRRRYARSLQFARGLFHQRAR